MEVTPQREVVMCRKPHLDSGLEDIDHEVGSCEEIEEWRGYGPSPAYIAALVAKVQSPEWQESEDGKLIMSLPCKNCGLTTREANATPCTGAYHTW